jgi:DNA end-binding protein Ku
MPARALSTATISFGLVSIPVKLYSAAESKAALSFNQIHKKDGSRVKQQLISSRSGEVVPREEIVKGYEFAKDQYVLFEADELKALEATATHTIDITEFLKAEQSSGAISRRSTTLAPRKAARARTSCSRKFSSTRARRNRQVRGARQAISRHGAADGERPRHGAAALPDELRAFSEVPIEDADVKPAELKLATQLVEQAASDEFNPETTKTKSASACWR